MYGDDFDEHLDRCVPGHDLLPPPPAWPRRLLGFGLLALLVVLHACG